MSLEFGFEENSTSKMEAPNATYSTLVCPVKMEYGPENNIFGLKMMMKSGLKKFFDIPPCTKPFLENLFYFIERGIFESNCKFSNKNDILCAWRDFNKTFCGISTCHK